MTAKMMMTPINPWRIAGWTLLATLLALPAVAMRFTSEVDWTASDFVTMGVMLGALGIGCELVARTSLKGWHFGAIAAALIVVFLLLWAELAVGIVGA